jgi:hypothetical protein
MHDDRPVAKLTEQSAKLCLITRARRRSAPRAWIRHEDLHGVAANELRQPQRLGGARRDGHMPTDVHCCLRFRSLI